ncbi:peptidoglycan/xylan/chitin deacetylase (PgdA/CDA1 family) [Natronospira proteinivora]|uniref:Peptidoglycan/xylan/chitin deacetylase (PgdA/CDA1 family) n=1 Tax=Natronospira proteinivora TaxID=1807133 RepID=A0ABT1GAF4_9GAMM|nr:polysaccharide deacetylase family protein [Natronospira proteinivora]MCP1726907.1 peptidoglycan/xylan/chitin deacetylase (PgdA/CDA1 family) [Natronospira proteinivora]
MPQLSPLFPTRITGLFLLTLSLSSFPASLDWQSALSDFEKRYPQLGELDTPELPSARGESHYHGNRNREQRRVALTFDACSRWTGNRKDARVLSILKENEIQATLFLGGRWMIENPELTRRWAENPDLEIGTHGYRHPRLTELSAEDQMLEISYAQAAALAITGHWPRYFRPPFAEYNQDTLSIAAKLGLELIQFDVASGDADPDQSPEAVAEHVLDNIRPGSIVVLHLHQEALPTAEALPLILEGLAERDLDPVTIPTLLGS